MLDHKIGETAGHIWHTLEEEGSLGLAALKKQIDAPDPILHMALGWLAREDKIAIIAEGRGFRVQLK